MREETEGEDREWEGRRRMAKKKNGRGNRWKQTEEGTRGEPEEKQAEVKEEKDENR